MAAAYGDLTLFCASDSHYGYYNTVYEYNSADASRAALLRMNALPGQPYPAGVGGGTVDSVRGILFAGDVTHNETPDQWSWWTNGWGLNGERLVSFPVYEAYGNHGCGFSFDPTTGIGTDAANLSVVPDGIRARNALRSTASDKHG